MHATIEDACMELPKKNERKARGGAARAQVLSPERRKEIAQEAAARRWGPSKVEREAVRRPAGRFKRVLLQRNLTVTKHLSANGSTVDGLAVFENGVLLRTFAGDKPRAEEALQGYLAALKDLGIVVALTRTEAHPDQHELLPDT
jgi:hypothetical protein